MIQKKSKVVLVALSNALPLQMKEKIEELCKALREMDLVPVCSDYLYQTESVRGSKAKLKAEELERFYEDKTIRAIFDVSGGDIANEVLDEYFSQNDEEYICKKAYEKFYKHGKRDEKLLAAMVNAGFPYKMVKEIQNSEL